MLPSHLPLGSGALEILQALRDRVLDREEHWTRGVWARDRDGVPCHSYSDRCCRVCLQGGLNRLAESCEGFGEAERLLTEAVGGFPSQWALGRGLCLSQFNDDPRTGFREIRWVLNRAVVLAGGESCLG